MFNFRHTSRFASRMGPAMTGWRRNRFPQQNRSLEFNSWSTMRGGKQNVLVRQHQGMSLCLDLVVRYCFVVGSLGAEGILAKTLAAIVWLGSWITRLLN